MCYRFPNARQFGGVFCQPAWNIWATNLWLQLHGAAAGGILASRSAARLWVRPDGPSRPWAMPPPTTERRRPMPRAYNVIAADGHILEPLNLWVDYIDPKYRDSAPKLVRDAGGKQR